MAESLSLRTEKSNSGRNYQRFNSDLEATPLVSELLDRPPVAASLPIQPWSESSLAVARPWQVQLDLGNLACFEVVNHQFQHQGVIFDNAIALWPSNPAFPPRSGTTVLMGAPKTGLIEAKFLHPVSSVSGFVTSPRCTVLSAYDHNDQLIAVAELTEGNLANSNSSLPANAELFLTASNIYRVVFSTFGSHLTLDDISFSR
ncbi:hypothetical protein NDA01_14175 [Trichocoleus desertorum AS-A10]|uniref:hypothetical protein n=1 Tax=Trichocoleus desertorum TaxID=1481672 RepID=UPI00329736E2